MVTCLKDELNDEEKDELVKVLTGKIEAWLMNDALRMSIMKKLS